MYHQTFATGIIAGIRFAARICATIAIIAVSLAMALTMAGIVPALVMTGGFLRVIWSEA